MIPRSGRVDHAPWWRPPAVVGWLVLLIVGLVVAAEVAERQPEFVPLREITVGPRESRWVVEWVLPAGHATDAGLRHGDEIVAVAGRPITVADAPADWLATAADLTIERAQERVTVSLRSAEALGLTGRFAYALAGLLFTLVGVATWLRSGGGRVQAAFLLLCSSAGLGLAAVPAVWRGQPWAALVLYGCATGAVTALLIFARRFPYDRHAHPGRWRPAPEWLMAVPAGFTLLYLLDAIGLAHGVVGEISPLRSLWILAMIAAMVGSVGQNWWHAHRTADQRALAQLTIIGGGAVLGFLPVLLTIGLYLVTGSQPIDSVAVVPTTVLLPLAAAYAMLRYRVMDADLVMRRSIIWGVAALLYVAVLALCIEIITLLVPNGGAPWQRGAIIAVALALVPLLNLLVRHLDQVVYGRDHDPRQTLAEAARALATTLDEAHLLALALERVLLTCRPALVCLYERAADGRYLPVVWQRRHEPLGVDPPPAALSLDHPAVARAATGQSWQVGGTLLRGDGRAPETDPARPTLLVPAGAPLEGGQVPWMLGLAARPSGLPYSHEDITLLEALTQGLAAALANARHYGRLQQAHADLGQIQLQLVQAAKLAAVGELASSVAHELNQPLMVIRARLQQLMPQVDPAVVPRLQRLERQTDKMAAIIDHLRSFARRSQDERRPVQVAAVVEETLLLLAEPLRERNIELVVAVAPTLPPVLGDAGQLEQVLINLLTNARDAVGGRPEQRISITTTLLDQEPPMLALLVSDTGAGIPPEALAQIFDPFFTTKPEGQGTGLGLSISRGIIERHGGRLEVQSTSGAGTTIRIVLPVLPCATDDATSDNHGDNGAAPADSGPPIDPLHLERSSVDVYAAHHPLG